jgi:hypothetical protein
MEVPMADDEEGLAYFYEHLDTNHFNLLIN